LSARAVVLRGRASRRACRGAAAQALDAAGLFAAAGAASGEFVDPAGEAGDVALAAVEFDVDAAQALVDGLHLALGVGAGGDGGGEAGAGGGQGGLGGLEGVGAGGQQLGGLDAVEAGAQGVGFFLGGVELGRISRRRASMLCMSASSCLRRALRASSPKWKSAGLPRWRAPRRSRW
jgi:hypothetical protein